MSDTNKIAGDVLAAISMALYEMFDEVHDVESNMLTIKRLPQEYSPWNDKGLGMLKMPSK